MGVCPSMCVRHGVILGSQCQIRVKVALGLHNRPTVIQNVRSYKL